METFIYADESNKGIPVPAAAVPSDDGSGSGWGTVFLVLLCVVCVAGACGLSFFCLCRRRMRNTARMRQYVVHKKHDTQQWRQPARYVDTPRTPPPAPAPAVMVVSDEKLRSLAYKQRLADNNI